MYDVLYVGLLLDIYYKENQRYHPTHTCLFHLVKVSAFPERKTKNKTKIQCDGWMDGWMNREKHQRSNMSQSQKTYVSKPYHIIHETFPIYNLDDGGVG